MLLISSDRPLQSANLSQHRGHPRGRECPVRQTREAPVRVPLLTLAAGIQAHRRPALSTRAKLDNAASARMIRNLR